MTLSEFIDLIKCDATLLTGLLEEDLMELPVDIMVNFNDGEYNGISETDDGIRIEFISVHTKR